MKIILDGFGGDNAPCEIVKGAILALKEELDFTIVLVGDKTILEEELSKYSYEKLRIKILEAPEVITNDEMPVEAIRTKRNSSIVVGLNYLKTEKRAAFVSAGSSGAVLTGAVLLLRRITGITRPALIPVLPTIQGGKVLLVDCGANVDSRPEQIVQFAHLGKAFAEAYLEIKNPRIGLLNNGAEKNKGTEIYREANEKLLLETQLNFIGNVEARDMYSGFVDIIVCDGFEGNIALKASEGTAQMVLELLKNGIQDGGVRSKIGYLFLKPTLRKMKQVLDYNDAGGAVLVGLEKIVIKTHGSSKAKAIKNTILQARSLVLSNINDKISRELQKVKEDYQT